MSEEGPSFWSFLRDEQNREALKIVGGFVVALAIAAWTVFLELRSRRRLAEVEKRIEAVEALQADLLRRLEHTDRNHDILVGALTFSAGVIKVDQGVTERPSVRRSEGKNEQDE